MFLHETINECSPRHDAGLGGIVFSDMAIPTPRFRIPEIVRCTALIEGPNVMSLKTPSATAFHTPPAVAGENLLAESRPLPLVQSGMVSASRVALAHPTITDRSGRLGRVFFARR